MRYLRKIKLHHILYTLAILGVVFYALSPLLFPDSPGLRQPELLPVYCAMLGLGQIVKGNLQITGGFKSSDNNSKNEDSVPDTSN